MLRDFTAAFDKRLIGLTGTQEQIADVAHALGVKFREGAARTMTDYVVDHSIDTFRYRPVGPFGAVTFKFAEPYMIAAKLFELLDRSGTALAIGQQSRRYR